MVDIAELGPPRSSGHERIFSIADRATGLMAYVAVHDTTLGPAFGGCRMRNYPSRFAALRDAMRLAQAMTCKSAMAGLDFGGGKCVVMGDPARHKTDALLLALAQGIHQLGGIYHTADDSGTSVRDMEVMRRVTPFARGLALPSGKACPAAAYGAFLAIQAAVAHCFGRSDLMNRRIAVQGLGELGMRLCAYLAEAGARLIVADTRADRADQAARDFGAQVVLPEDILSCPADVLSPNAYGGVINDATVPRFRARIIAGAANNQLRFAHHGEALRQRGILFVPDYVVSAGGVIDVAQEGPGYSPALVLRACEAIYQTTARLLRDADRAGLAPSTLADQTVARRIGRRPLGMDRSRLVLEPVS